MRKKIYKGTALDLIQTVHMENHVPIVYCYMALDKAIDTDRLKQAVTRTAEIVPQILCRYNDLKNAWYPAEYDSHSVVKNVSAMNCYKDLVWDLRIDPQLRINVCHQDAGDILHIGMSHILTDGAGFQQYLALLCKFYNEPDLPVSNEVNCRSIIPLLFQTALQRLPRINKHIHKGNIPAFLPYDQDKGLLHSLKVTLSEEQLKMVQKKAKQLHVTLNDLFMAAYACALKASTLREEIILPCPADLRKYDRRNGNLTIANMTGKYLCHISLAKENRLREIALAVHKEMEWQKSRYSCFHQVPLLQILHAVLPNRVLRLAVRPLYSVEATSYTNMGTIDEHGVFFQGMSIKECYLCGTYRQSPSFQVSISTYKNVCTLAANMLATEEQRISGMRLLKDMKSSLLCEFPS